MLALPQPDLSLCPGAETLLQAATGPGHLRSELHKSVAILYFFCIWRKGRASPHPSCKSRWSWLTKIIEGMTGARDLWCELRLPCKPDSTISLSDTVRVCVLSRVWLFDPMGYTPPGSSVPGILQARILEWVAISFSRGSSWPRDGTPISCVSCISRWILYHCTT